MLSHLGIVPPSALMVVVTALVAMGPRSIVAHDIPTDVNIRAFVKPEGQRLNLVMFHQSAKP